MCLCLAHRARCANEIGIVLYRESAAPKMRHEHFRLVGGHCDVFAAADPDLLVCGTSLWEVLAGASGGGLRGGPGGVVAARDGVFDSVPARTFRRLPARGGGDHCGARFDRAGDLDLLASAPRLGNGAAGGESGTRRNGRIGTPRNLRADSASAIRRVVRGTDGRVPVGRHACGVDCRGGLDGADACGNIVGGEGTARAFWSVVRGLLQASAAIYSGDSWVREVLGVVSRLRSLGSSCFRFPALPGGANLCRASRADVIGGRLLAAYWRGSTHLHKPRLEYREAESERPGTTNGPFDRCASSRT